MTLSRGIEGEEGVAPDALVTAADQAQWRKADRAVARISPAA